MSGGGGGREREEKGGQAVRVSYGYILGVSIISVSPVPLLVTVRPQDVRCAMPTPVESSTLLKVMGVVI